MPRINNGDGLCRKSSEILLKIIKSRLLYLFVLVICFVFVFSRFMSFTFFHDFARFDFITKRQGSFESQQMIVDLNERRIEMAMEYFEKLQNDHQRREKLSQLLKPAENKDLAITIVTIDRFQYQFNTRPRYLTQTVARLLEQLEKYYQSTEEMSKKLSIELSFCVVDLEPATNEEVAFLHEATGLEFVLRFANGAMIPANYLQLTNRFEREKQDYVFCLNSTRPRRPRFTLVLEDDAPPIHDYFNILEKLLDDSSGNNHGSDYTSFNLSSSVLYLKLYHPDSLLGFHSLDRERIPQLLAVATFLTLITFLINEMLKNHCFGTCSISSSKFPFKFVDEFADNVRRDFWFNFAKFSLYFGLIVFVIGRPNTVTFYQQVLAKHFNLVTLVPTPSCCTPAIIYPQQSLPIVVNFLTETQSYEKYAKDGILDDLRRTLGSNKTSWLVQPNLHSHIGQFSVVRSRENGNYRLFLGV